ncbi:MAG: FAD-dependent oxidoreductase [Candidatus Solibacter sp.]
MTGLAKKYIDTAVAEAQAAGYADHPVRAMAAWDAIKPGAWLQSKGASHGAAELLRLGFGMEFGSAASYLLHRLNSMGGRGSYRVEGGNDNLPRAFARHVELRYGAPVLAVTQDERGVQVKCRRAGTIETLAGDRAVCALPCPVIAGILDGARVAAAKQRAIREQHYSLTAKARQIFPEFVAEFEGGVSKAWGADPWQRGAFALHTPGQIGFLTVLAQAEGRVHFAGEHTSHWTGWMQGALDSARRVVREINT